MHPSYVRQYNATRIFHALRANPGITKRGLTDLTGCDKSTVSAILRAFEDIGFVESDAAQETGKRGRPSANYRLSADNGLLIGVHLEFEQMAIVAASIDGTPIRKWSQPLPTDPAALATDLRHAIGALCHEISRSQDEIRAIGITLPGLVESSGGLAHAPSLDWYETDIGNLLRDQIGAPVYIDNDTNAAAMAEYLFGQCGQLTDFVMIDGGLGLGGGIFLDGRPYRGASGFGGELGHIKVVPDGRICGCGAQGCLSAYIAAPALLAAAQRSLRVRNVEELIRAAKDGAPPILDLFEDSGRHLGRALSDIVNIFNPSAIVLGGIVGRIWPYAEITARKELAKLAMRAPLQNTQILVSDISAAETPVGAVALALEGFTSLDGQKPGPW
ncbi:MarR family transcriptional regulator [Rhodobacter sp. JA431]|uniref:ROK family transcriptional regulator n=1 Tax=Rhodobacter sp. JA431 TaxID=570013 RepID=UPI000BDB8E46|nr:ROK family transcriptional regulator [Rhodobacter sp. JA431]SOC10407.1 MarR family transcriptional regulator [Rhodobacter sp. JA431]